VGGSLWFASTKSKSGPLLTDKRRHIPSGVRIEQINGVKLTGP